MNLKDYKTAITTIIHKYLFIKDIFNALLWVAISWYSMQFFQLLFGKVNAPMMGMSHLSKGLMGVGLFAIMISASWAMQRLFFPTLTSYFTDPDGKDGDKKSKFQHDILKLWEWKQAEENLKPVITRLCLHLGFYFLWFLALRSVVVLLF